MKSLKKKVATKLLISDKVMVISGKYKGKDGKILSINKEKNRVVVEGINIQKKTMKKSQENPQGGIIEKEGAIHISNVMYYDGEKASRLSYQISKEGKKERYVKKVSKVIS